MSLITNGARFLLFGPKMDARVTLANVAKRKGINLARGAFGMPPLNGPGFIDWLIHQAKLFWALLTGRHPDALPLPDDLPAALFNTINETLRNRGGLHDKDLQLPNYWCSPTSATSTPFFWSLVVDYASAADPSKLASFEMAIEDQLTKAGFDLNVRIGRRPLRLEIDKPTPPVITLAELWPTVATYPQNARWAVLGLAYIQGQSTTLSISLDGEDFSAFIAGRPGSGKTQLSMGILLSLAYTNSPDSLTMIIIDPKAIDFRPFNALPHLALPVVNEPTQAAEVIQWLCDEMDRRTAQAARGDNSFFKHSLLLYVDELADLYLSLPSDQAEQFVKNFQRLGQKGRGVGFIIIGATQRVFDIPDALHGKLNARFAGKARNAGDSVAISGVPGTTTNRLPGRGSFELYCSDQTGLRLQAPFVAASDKPNYAKALQPFFADIRARWGDSAPGWMSPGHQNDQAAPQPPTQDAAPTSDQPTAPPTVDQATEQAAAPAPTIDPALLAELREEYANDPDAFSVRTVRRVWALLYHREVNHARAKPIFDTFMQMSAAGLLEN